MMARLKASEIRKNGPKPDQLSPCSGKNPVDEHPAAAPGYPFAAKCLAANQL
jgi:hypothetical protein